MDRVALNSAHFINSKLTKHSLTDATVKNSMFCGVYADQTLSVQNVTIVNVTVNGRNVSDSTTFVNSLVNSSVGCSEEVAENIKNSFEFDCPEEEEDDDRVYRDNFIISASALPGNIVSAIAVYFLRRNGWVM